MNTIFDSAECCLFDADIVRKLETTHQTQRLAKAGQLSFAETHPPRPIADTLFPDKPLLLMPRDMPRRRLHSIEGKAAFFHSLAHIEFMAIYLAWDIIYRFRGLPEQFYRDWLKIADEEAQHFELLSSHLLTLGIGYGDLAAHKGLWSHAEDTADDLLARLAVVPRCMEARGLDVTPVMIDKLKAMNDEAGVAILTRIYQDEVGHVERGSFWFNYFSKQHGLDPEQTFKDKILACYQGKPKGPFNRDVRIIAGFTHNEIDWLEERLHE
ncbi:hypothetical protein A1359_11190 [Methylomonas lenta]|uniref:Rhamnosyltransferase n=1 Tax=Methylomonas lenta TaxID=980561 RepID=A0A177N8N5_9GAMM|nr:ferritin-like domain-containing protein [Methylomonas lenta]OAI14378.1 hypothetical protein A1359_11190 [Methylomonas lenta]